MTEVDARGGGNVREGDARSGARHVTRLLVRRRCGVVSATRALLLRGLCGRGLRRGGFRLLGACGGKRCECERQSEQREERAGDAVTSSLRDHAAR